MTDNNSILKSIRKQVGVSYDCDTAFDDEIIFAINSAIAELTQIGVGPSEGFEVYGEDEQWDDFLETTDPRYNFAKGYVKYSVKLEVDPPSNSTLFQSMKEKMNEYYYRCEVRAHNEDI